MYPRLFEIPAPLVGTITVYTYGVLLAAAYLLGLKLAMVRANNMPGFACSTSSILWPDLTVTARSVSVMTTSKPAVGVVATGN